LPSRNELLNNMEANLYFGCLLLLCLDYLPVRLKLKTPYQQLILSIINGRKKGDEGIFCFVCGGLKLFPSYVLFRLSDSLKYGCR